MGEYHKLSQGRKSYGSCIDDNEEEWIGHADRDGDLDRTERRETFSRDDIDDGVSVSSAKSFLGASIGNFRGASLSISMLAKPSDDRKASAPLAGRGRSFIVRGTQYFFELTVFEHKVSFLFQFEYSKFQIYFLKNCKTSVEC